MDLDGVKIVKFLKKPGESSLRTWLCLACITFSLKKGILKDEGWRSMLGPVLIKELEKMVK